MSKQSKQIIVDCTESVRKKVTFTIPDDSPAINMSSEELEKYIKGNMESFYSNDNFYDHNGDLVLIFEGERVLEIDYQNVNHVYDPSALYSNGNAFGLQSKMK